MLEFNCKFCNELFLQSRSNQFYCSDDHRYKANNLKARKERGAIGAIELKLKKNYRIVNELMSRGVKMINKDELFALGFIPSAYSSYYHKDECTVFIVFDVQLIFDGETIKINKDGHINDGDS